MRPAFSVIIPTRNRRDFALRAVACALAQVDVDVEVLLVDDCSTDGSRECLAAIEDSRVRLLDGPGRGPSAARNRALEHAAAAWVAFLDDDDLWAPNKLARLAQRAGDAGFGVTSAVVIEADGRPLRIDDAPDPHHLDTQLLRRNAIGTPSVLVARTELLRDLEGFDEELSVIGDWELWIRLSAVAPAFAIGEPLTAYTVHADGISVSHTRVLSAELDYLLDKHEDRFRRSGCSVDMDWYTRWNADGLQRQGRRLAAAGCLLRQAGRGRSIRSLTRAGRLLVGEGVSSRLRPPAPPPDPPRWLSQYHTSLAN